MQLEKGYVQVYTGNGKGKTTAAFGLAMRVAGRGLKAHVIQFMKSEEGSGETIASKKLSPNITVEKYGRKGFVDKKKLDPKDIELANAALSKAREILKKKSCNVLILDEINVAMDFGLIETHDVLNMIKTKPSEIEIVLTGRSAPREILDAADLVTEMKEVKHYYSKGVEARIGIET